MSHIEMIYDFISKKNREFSTIYDVTQDGGTQKQKALCKELLKLAHLKESTSNTVAVLQRVVNLRDDGLVVALENEGKSEEEIILVKHAMYEATKKIHLGLHVELLEFIKSNNLLNEFYQNLFEGVHKIGIAFSNWQPTWTKYIIEGINEELKRIYKDSELVAKMLREKNLFDLPQCDRSYSALVRVDGGYENRAYAEVFKDEVLEVVESIDELLCKLEVFNDDIYNQKDEWLRYFRAIKEALNQKDVTKLLGCWQEVDEAWMQIKTPIQVGHPLEYYEDHYKKAVALEWDIRLSKGEKSSDVQKSVKYMYKMIFDELGGEEFANIYTLSSHALEKVQLYLGRPALYYGAEFNGLFSAQVVPNDEAVTKKYGKKIFAFGDNVLDSARAKPFLKIQKIVFPKEFLKECRRAIFQDAPTWHRVYEITTIGHEFGHILWMDEDSEVLMNQSGMFKNIEEFKATMGGLMAYFVSGDEGLKKEIFNDIVKRAVGLIGWMKTPEVEPYYCEGLIHLHVLFQSGVLRFDDRLHIEFENYGAMVECYVKTYKELAMNYLYKKDAKEFLSKFVVYGDVCKPVDTQVRRFVDYYWQMHCEMGCEVDESDSKEEYM